LTPPLAHLTALGQQPVHHRHRAQVGAGVEQAGPHLTGGEVAELLAVEHLHDVVTLGV
jgi:hypothetical protein